MFFVCMIIYMTMYECMNMYVFVSMPVVIYVYINEHGYKST